MSDVGSHPILILVRDLMFVSKITATARAQGTQVKLIRDPSKLVGEKGMRLIVDLNLDGAIPAAAAWKRSTGGEVAGFVSHVDAATIDQARATGIDCILARSEFVQILPELLSGGTGSPAN